MSVLSQFSGGGIPRPAGTLNGTAALSPQITDIVAATGLAAVNAKTALSGALTANTLATVLSLSGKGVISFLACAPVDATSRTHRYKITLDGTVIFDATSGATNSTQHYVPVIGALLNLSSTYSVYSIVPEPLFFNTSLLIEYASSVSETDKTRHAYKYYAR